MTVYVNRSGEKISRDVWLAFYKTPDYGAVRKYDNGEVCVELEWLGREEDAGNRFPDMWRIYGLRVWNYDSSGNQRVDPVENGKRFPDEKTAIKAYETFIERWTDSSTDADGTFNEVGNDLTPEPPPSPDLPSSEASTIKLGVDMDDSVW